VLSNLLRVYDIALVQHPNSEAVRPIAERRRREFSAELEAVRGARTLDGLRRRTRDELARARSRLRPGAVWHPADAPPVEVHRAFPDLFPV
jgi:hypothetical protein